MDANNLEMQLKVTELLTKVSCFSKLSDMVDRLEEDAQENELQAAVGRDVRGAQ